MKNRPVDSVSRTHVGAESIQQGAIEKQRRRKIGDILREAFGKRIERRSSDLKGLVEEGGAQVERKKFKAQIKNKVWDSMDPLYANDDIVEEVTERLLEVAENDLYYRKILSRHKK